MLVHVIKDLKALVKVFDKYKYFNLHWLLYPPAFNFYIIIVDISREKLKYV